MPGTEGCQYWALITELELYRGAALVGMLRTDSGSSAKEVKVLSAHKHYAVIPAPLLSL